MSGTGSSMLSLVLHVLILLALLAMLPLDCLREVLDLEQEVFNFPVSSGLPKEPTVQVTISTAVRPTDSTEPALHGVNRPAISGV